MEEEEEEDSSESDDLQPVPNKQMSPFDVRFSQMRARSQFRDGRLVQTAIEEIQPVRHPSAKEVAVEGGGAGDGPVTESSKLEEVWRLEAPFPPIEVLHWRCKLRDEQTGRPRIDPKTGGECYDEHRWFTLDNRRLYCLQKVAASLHPARAVIDVVELPPGSLTRARQIKKFRTLDSGRSIMIGGRDGRGVEHRLRWSWREATGTEAEASEPDVDNCHVQMRRRPRKGMRGLPQHRQQSGMRCSAADGERGSSWTGLVSSHTTSLSGMLVFVVIYVALRLSVNTLSAAYKQWR